jgi:hypothetical protein
MSKFEKSLRNKPAWVVLRARAIADKVRAGTTANAIDARRMAYDRTRLSVEIGRAWRVVLLEVDGELRPLALLSHEDYSRGAKVGRRR